MAILAALVPRVASAQLAYRWTFDDLTQRADCIIIAEAGDTRDTGRRTTHPELKPGYPVVELDTVFNVRSVLKSCGREPTVAMVIHLRHFAPDQPKLSGGLVNGGSWLALETGKAYLLFLKRGAGDVLEPLTGYTWPTESVYAVNKPDGELVRPPPRR